MADITNPEAIRFINEAVRPLCESVRLLKAQIDTASVTWFGGIDSLVPNTSDSVEDGRENEGVSRLTGADVNNAITQFLALQASLDQIGVADIISKPCVRNLLT